jgi:L-ascorbate metabolism protein UlaG (beta-lactamase superfamily)
MEIEYYGANCFRIKTKEANIVIDDNIATLGGKVVAKGDEVLVYTSTSLSNEKAIAASRLVLDSAGEYEVGDISVTGIQTRGHMDESGVETATVYQFIYKGTTVTVLGHVHPDLSDEVSELAGGTDVLIVPVGGNGYTLDAVGATGAIKKTEPDVVIPSQYDIAGLTYEVPGAPLEEFLKTSGLQQAEPTDSYKLDKPNAELAGSTHLVILNKK